MICFLAGWKPKTEHMFSLDGQTVAGFLSLGQQQHTGIRYRGNLRLQKEPTGDLLLKVATSCV
jgi:hypothetical protein